MLHSVLTIVIYVPTFNAGETTRGVELARALSKKAEQENQKIQTTFVQAVVEGPSYVSLIERAGFKTEFTEVTLTEKIVREIMTADHSGREFISDFETAKRFTESHLADLKKRRPHLVIFGFIPPAGIACALENIPCVAFLPFPAHRPWAAKHLVKDIPDALENFLTFALPKWMRQKIASLLSKLVVKQGFFTQPNFAKAGLSLGWKPSAPNLFTMLKADLQLVNDLPKFYSDQSVGESTVISGPLFSKPMGEKVDAEILNFLQNSPQKKVLLMMGSSGELSYFLEALRAAAQSGFATLALLPPAIGKIAEIRASVKLPASVFLTDQFLPAPLLAPLFDAAIIHGGQGTLQTVLEAGVPFLGVAMQAEQQANLDNAAALGAGMRLPRRYWRERGIGVALQKLLREPEFASAAKDLSKSFLGVNGHDCAAEEIWGLLLRKGLVSP